MLTKYVNVINPSEMQISLAVERYSIYFFRLSRKQCAREF
jgi:hypothetical protein